MKPTAEKARAEEHVDVVLIGEREIRVQGSKIPLIFLRLDLGPGHASVPEAPFGHRNAGRSGGAACVVNVHAEEAGGIQLGRCGQVRSVLGLRWRDRVAGEQQERCRG